MMKQAYPVPPPELVSEWWSDSDGTLQSFATKAVRWGYQQCDAEYERAAMQIVPPTWLEPEDMDNNSSESD